MAANQVDFRLVLTSAYQPISSTSLIARGRILSMPTNSTAYKEGVGGADVEWPAGLVIDYQRAIDLSLAKFKGTPGDVICFIGEAGE